MKEIPEEFKQVLHNPELREAVVKHPGSKRFKAMVLGLTALQYIKDQAKGEANSRPDPD